MPFSDVSAGIYNKKSEGRNRMNFKFDFLRFRPSGFLLRLIMERSYLRLTLKRPAMMAKPKAM